MYTFGLLIPNSVYSISTKYLSKNIDTIRDDEKYSYQIYQILILKSEVDLPMECKVEIFLSLRRKKKKRFVIEE